MAYKMTSFVEAHLAGDYASETGSTCGRGPQQQEPLFQSSMGSRPPPPKPRVGHVGAGITGFAGPSPMAGLDAYSRHKKFINDYVISLGEKRVERYLADRQPEVGKTDYDILQENHKFIRETETDDMSNWEVPLPPLPPHPSPTSHPHYILPRRSKSSACESCFICPGGWQVRMAVKYYSKLFKEYCIADMSRYKTAQIGLRWRTQVSPRVAALLQVWPTDVFFGVVRCGSEKFLAVVSRMVFLSSLSQWTSFCDWCICAFGSKRSSAAMGSSDVVTRRVRMRKTCRATK